MDTTRPDWIADCTKWRGRVLTGEASHWCDEWDGLPIDETTPEWPCLCAADVFQDRVQARAALLLEPFIGRPATEAMQQEIVAVFQADPDLQRWFAIMTKASP